MANYLVTGVAGFIGAAVAKSLIAQGHRVIGVDNLSTGYQDAVPNGVEFYEAGCEAAATWEVIPALEYAAILHIAGQSSGEVSFENPVYDLQTNAQSTLLLLQLARKLGVKRFLYASTMSVYGDQPDTPVKESALCAPKSFYGVGKLASEHYLRIYAEQFGLETVALRLFNVYGPGQNMANLKQGMVSIYLAQALKDRHILVKGSADRFRDFVYIDDVVAAFEALLEAPIDGYRCYNIATGQKTTVGNLINAIAKALPFEPTVEFTAGTPGDQFGITGDAALIAQEIGWRPRIAMDEGLKRMVAWAL
ncbi:MAG: NAD-dependent epimerase/dehydratase family protein [Campylobacterales bacterium]